jgi:hypothetical protein
VNRCVPAALSGSQPHGDDRKLPPQSPGPCEGRDCVPESNDLTGTATRKSHRPAGKRPRAPRDDSLARAAGATRDT